MKVLMVLFTFLMPFLALAESQPVPDLPPGEFFAQVIEVIKQFGGLPTVLKIAAVITLLISSMKVSFLRELFWEKLGQAKAWVAPLLGLIAGILGLAHDGPLTWPVAFAYLSAGAGAIILHELLDSIKALPGLGEIYVKVIDLVQKALGGKSK